MGYEFYYFTEEDYEVAAANGISREQAYNRRYLGWSKQDAITKPLVPKRRALYWKYEELCKKHGISRKTFDARVKKGMKPELAATKNIIIGGHENPKLTKEQVAVGVANGISKSTIHNRVYNCHWDPQLAVTLPLGTKLREYNKNARRTV